MLCAAAAGDASTARAIYLASKVRRLDHLRTCGGKDHLVRLQGLIPEDEKMRLSGDDGNSSPSLFGIGASSPNALSLRTIEGGWFHASTNETILLAPRLKNLIFN
jgi:hypothetical protein